MNTKTVRILRQVSEEAHDKFKDRLYKEVEMFSATVELIKRAEEDWDNLSEKERKAIQRIKTIQEAGMLEGKEKVIVTEVAEEMDKYIEEEIERLVKEGTIPNPKKDKELLDYNKKLKKWIKRKERKS